MPSVFILITANLLPVYGVLFLGWKVFPIIILFWMENVIIGFFNVLKILFASPNEPVKWLGKVFLIPFFCVHYGMFTMAHGMFVLGMFGGGFQQGATFPELHTIIQIVFSEHLQWSILSLAASHSLSFLLNYIGRGEYREASTMALMQQPYGRVIVLHITILGGGFLLMLLHSPVLGLLLFVVLKVTLDIRAHLAERKKFHTEQVKREPIPVFS